MEQATSQHDKARENRVRRSAHRQECSLVKSRRHDWTAGTYMLVDWYTNGAIMQYATLDDVEDWLAKPVEPVEPGRTA